MTRLPSRASGFVLLAAVLALWQVSALYWTDSPNWPPLGAVLTALASGLASGELLGVFGDSLARMGAGYAIGSAVAIAAGLLIAKVPLLRAMADPVIELLRPIPVPAVIPPLILLLGIDDALKIFVIAFTVFFPVLTNTVAGVRSIDPVSLDTARTLRVGFRATLLSVALPAALPAILAGMRIGLALALIVTVTAEMIAGSSGIGYYLTTTQYAMRAADMYAAVVLLAIAGYALNRVFVWVERRALRRHGPEHAEV